MYRASTPYAANENHESISWRILRDTDVFFGRAPIASGAWAGSLVSVPVWLLGVVLALLAIAVGVAAVAALRRRRKGSAETAPSTKAEIFGIRWRWKYQEDDIRDITSYCPMCDIEVRPREETRHGFLHLISYECDCGKWRSKSFQCSHVALIEQVCRTIQKQART